MQWQVSSKSFVLHFLKCTHVCICRNKIISWYRKKWGFTEDYLEVYENCAYNLSNKLRLNKSSSLILPYLNLLWNLCTYLFSILLQNKKTPIKNSCRSNLWSTPILTLWNTELRILRKTVGDEVFRVLFKFPRRGWDQRLADFKNRNTELWLLFSIISP